MINKVILVGNVGRDPEIRSTQSGTQVANFSLATNERRRDANGEWTDHTEWHKLVVWGRMVGVVEQYVGEAEAGHVGSLRHEHHHHAVALAYQVGEGVHRRESSRAGAPTTLLHTSAKA